MPAAVIFVTAAPLLAPPTAARIVSVVVSGAVGVAGSLAFGVVVAPAVDAPGRVLDAAFAGAIAVSVTALAAQRLGWAGALAFGSTWSVFVFQPVFAALVGSVPSLMQTVFGAVDYATVLATHLATAASFVALFTLPAPGWSAWSALSTLPPGARSVTPSSAFCSGLLSGFLSSVYLGARSPPPGW